MHARLPSDSLALKATTACLLLALNMACSGSTSPSDSGNPPDGGAPVDAGPPADSGLVADGGLPSDAGLSSDAGARSDAGLDGGADAGLSFTTMSVLNGDGNSILEWPVSANGNVAPTRTLAGANTQISAGNGLGADAQGNVYVLSNNAILVFAPGQSGNVGPVRTIGGSNVLPATHSFTGLYVEPTGKIWATSISGTFPLVGDVRAFAPGTTGNVAPVQIIAGANTTLGVALSIAASGTTVYVCNQQNVGAPSVLTFDENANGNPAPTRTLALVHGLQCGQMALDGKGNLYVSEWIGGGTVPTRILVFPPGATTSAWSLVQSPSDQLTFVTGLAVDEIGTMYVGNADPAASTLLVFSPGSDGGTSPIQTVSGSMTTLVPGSGFSLYLTLH